MFEELSPILRREGQVVAGRNEEVLLEIRADWKVLAAVGLVFGCWLGFKLWR